MNFVFSLLKKYYYAIVTLWRLGKNVELYSKQDTWAALEVKTMVTEWHLQLLRKRTATGTASDAELMLPISVEKK